MANPGKPKKVARVVEPLPLDDEEEVLDAEILDAEVVDDLTPAAEIETVLAFDLAPGETHVPGGKPPTKAEFEVLSLDDDDLQPIAAVPAAAAPAKPTKPGRPGFGSGITPVLPARKPPSGVVKPPVPKQHPGVKITFVKPGEKSPFVK